MDNITSSWTGYISLIAFILAYTLVIFEEKIHLKKSKPVVLIGCFMWFIIGMHEAGAGNSEEDAQFINDQVMSFLRSNN